MRWFAMFLLFGCVAACTAPTPAARQRAQAAAASPPMPRGFYASPPGDLSFDPLRCNIVGPETVCKRTAD
jgi:hypothetical protein